MSEPRHAPGTWSTDHSENCKPDYAGTVGYHCGHVIRNDIPAPHKPGDLVGWEIARVSGGGGYHLHNANLISAAPDLLEALSEVMAQYDSFIGYEDGLEDSTILKARAAIAKAEGRA